MKVVVEYLDGQVREYQADSTVQEGFVLKVLAVEYYGAMPKVALLVPLNNVREVNYQ